MNQIPDFMQFSVSHTFDFEWWLITVMFRLFYLPLNMNGAL